MSLTLELIAVGRSVRDGTGSMNPFPWHSPSGAVNSPSAKFRGDVGVRFKSDYLVVDNLAPRACTAEATPAREAAGTRFTPKGRSAPLRADPPRQDRPAQRA